MEPFRYCRPTNLSEVRQLLIETKGGVSPMLGGTDLMVKLTKGVIKPSVVMDLKGVTELSDEIVRDPGGLTIGARVLLADIAVDKQVKTVFPALAEAALSVGSVQIRNRGTLIGNVCNSSPAADTILPLMVFGASIELEGSRGRRSVLLNDFFTGPGTSIRQPDEIAVSVFLPFPEQPFGSAFGRMTRRKGVDLATVNLACGVDSDNMVSFVFGAVGPIPVAVNDDSGILADLSISDREKISVLRKMTELTSPRSDIRASRKYREEMLLVLALRSLKKALQHRAEGLKL